MWARWAGTIALGLAAMAAGLIGAFTLVTRARPSGDVQPVVAPFQLEQARVLRNQANRLGALVEAYLTRVPLESPAPTPAAEAWIARTFTAMVREARSEQEQLLRPGASTEGDLLRGALERLASAARNPGDRTLRRGAADDARRAIRAAEAWIDGVGARQHLGEPARLTEF